MNASATATPIATPTPTTRAPCTTTIRRTRPAWSISFRGAPYDPDPVFRALEDRRVPARDFIRQTFLPTDDGPLTA